MSCCNTATHKRLQRLLSCPCRVIPSTLQNSAQGFTGAFLRFLPFYHRRYQPRISGYNAACATLGRITAPQRLQRIPDTSATPDAVQVSTAAYYNKVYKGAGVRLLWIHARRCNTSQTIPARRGQRLHLHRVSPAAFDLAPVSGQGGRSGTLHPAGQSSGGRRGTIGGSRRISFRAFAR